MRRNLALSEANQQGVAGKVSQGIRSHHSWRVVKTNHARPLQVIAVELSEPLKVLDQLQTPFDCDKIYKSFSA